MNPGPSTASDNHLPATADASKRGAENSDQEPPRKRRPQSGAASQTVAHGWTALHRAAIDGDVERVKALLERGSDPRAKDGAGKTPLFLALLFGKTAVAEILADTYRPEDDEDLEHAPLHAAARRGYIGVLRKLIAAGADTLLLDPWGFTALQNALSTGMDAAAEILMDAGGASDVQGRGYSPVRIALAYERFGMAKKLLSREIDPHVKVEEKNPLQVASSKARDDFGKMVIAMRVWKGMAIDWGKMRLPHDVKERLVCSLSECEAEIRRMAATRIHDSCVSYHDVARRPTRRVARYLENESVREAVRADNVTANFPNYAELIALRVRSADGWRVLANQCERCFSLLERKLPLTCSDVVLLYLSERDMRNFITAFIFRQRKFP